MSYVWYYKRCPDGLSRTWASHPVTATVGERIVACVFSVFFFVFFFVVVGCSMLVVDVHFASLSRSRPKDLVCGVHHSCIGCRFLVRMFVIMSVRMSSYIQFCRPTAFVHRALRPVIAGFSNSLSAWAKRARSRVVRMEDSRVEMNVDVHSTTGVCVRCRIREPVGFFHSERVFHERWQLVKPVISV